MITEAEETQAPIIRPGITFMEIGSNWAGSPSDTVGDLLTMLAIETLDPRFYDCGNFFYTEDGKEFHAFGNFLTWSYAFNVSGSLEAMLPIARAIKMARRRPEYLRAWASSYRKPRRLK